MEIMRQLPTAGSDCRSIVDFSIGRHGHDMDMNRYGKHDDDMNLEQEAGREFGENFADLIMQCKTDWAEKDRKGVEVEEEGSSDGV